MFLPSARSVAVPASAKRLQQLIHERLQPGADRAAIDRRVWDLFGEHWAVMFTDLSGFSRRVAEFGIIHFLQVIQESLRILAPVIDRHDGILLKIEADSMLVIFRRPERAVACSVAMQRALSEYNAKLAPEDRILLCVGLGWGDVLRIGDQDVFGAQVNAASKLGEDIAKAGEILVTGELKDACMDATWAPTDEVPPGAASAWRLVY
jgi:class 3 adenylate cyclase